MPFTTENDIRRRHGFSAETEFHNETGTIFTLRIRAYAIIEILKNDIVLTEPTDYTFIRPKRIQLVDAQSLKQTDFMEIEYATEIKPIVVTDCREDAEEQAKAILADRFGESAVEAWEVNTPPYIKHRTTAIGGFLCERAMLRKGHDFDPDALETLERAIDRELRKLSKVDLGELTLIGQTPIEEEAVVGLGGDQIFAEMDQIEDADYHILYRQVDDRTVDEKDF